MVAKIARFLVKKGLASLAGSFLTSVSYFSGNKNKISYNNKGFWRHERAGLIINDTIPNFRLKNEQLFREAETSYFLNYKPSLNDICIDVGAGIGIETMYLSGLVGKLGKVYSIEASPKTYAILDQNLTDNHISNVETFQLAISNVQGKIRIGNEEEQHINNSIFGGNGDWVDSLTMDQFIINNNIPRINYLKANIEGAEKLLIEQFDQIHMVEHVAISCHDFLGERTNDPSLYTKKEVMAFLKHSGFKITTRSTGIDYLDDWVFGSR